jgi:hypothetical protein
MEKLTEKEWKNILHLLAYPCSRSYASTCTPIPSCNALTCTALDRIKQIGYIKKSAIDEFTELLNNIQAITYFTVAPMFPNFHNIKRKELMEKFIAAINEAKEQSHD